MKQFKPMLLSNDDYDLNTLDFQFMFASRKRDGVRAEVTREGLKGRSFKLFKNKNLQPFFKEVFENLPDDIIIDAEIYCEGMPCREIAGICNSNDKEIPENMKLYMFGIYHGCGFSNRIDLLIGVVKKYCKRHKCHIVKQTQVDSAIKAQEFFDNAIKDGYEGAVLMDGVGQYKCGRVTINEGIGYKMKPFREDDLLIIGVTERMENLNESQTNELGRSFKRNTVDAKKETGIAATFICKIDDELTVRATITGTEEYRRYVWEHQNEFIGKYACVKSMDYGTKDKPRHPTLIKIKEKCEK